MGRAEMAHVRAAWLRYIVLLAGLAVVITAILVFMWPQPLERLLEHYLFPEPIPAWSSMPSPEELSGCYALSLSEWIPRANLGCDVVFATPPVEIALTTERGSTPPLDGYYIVRPADESAATVHHMAIWHLSADHTLRIAFSTGFSGVSMELGPAEAQLVGRAKTFWDFPRMSQWSVVRASRIVCPDARESDEAVEQRDEPDDAQNSQR